MQPVTLCIYMNQGFEASLAPLNRREPVNEASTSLDRHAFAPT